MKKARAHVVTVWWSWRRYPEDQRKDWHWTRTAPNGKKVACSGEGYANKAHAIKMAKLCNVGIEVRVDDGK